MLTIGEWIEIVKKMADLTKRNLLEWEGNDQHLSCQIGDLVYFLGSVDSDGARPYYFSINQGTKMAGDQLARFETDSDDVVWAANDDGNEEDLTERILELRGLAIRVAMGAPKLVQDVLENLASVDPRKALPF